MAALITSITKPNPRSASISSFDDWTGLWGVNSLNLMLQTTMPPQQESSDGSFYAMVERAYLRNPIVYACLAMQARIFGEARFQFQQLRGGQPGALFGTPDLAVLERPAPGHTTRDLLQLSVLRAHLAGANFLLERPGRIHNLRPDWMTIAYGVAGKQHELGRWHPESEIIGYGFYPGGVASGSDPMHYLPEEMAYFAPNKNPITGSGVSILSAVLREVMADNAATTHKLSFFEAAATPNLALKFPASMTKEKALEWIELFEQEHRGALNAWKTVYLGAGVEPTPVGLNFQEMDYAKLQGKMETRVAAVTGMHPVVVGLSEGLQGSSLNAGNFSQASRSVATTTLHELWGDIAGTIERIVPAPPGARLWYDHRHIPFLREDVKDQAEITQKNAATIGQLIKDGFEPASAIDAVVADDMTRLIHTGLVSVQLQPPGMAIPSGGPPTAFRATRDFWAIDEPFAHLGTIRAGQSVPPDHPLLTTFSSLFEAEPATAPARIDLDAAEILAARERLRLEGKSHGYDSLARELNVSRDTIRRRLASTNHH